MNRVRTPSLVLAFLAAVGATPLGCSLSKPYPAKQLYTLDAGAPRGPAEATARTPDAPTKVLRVLRATVASPYSSVEFQHRVGPDRFEQDYYANWVTDPDRLITQQLIAWMSATGMYAAVVDGASSVKSSYSLRCVVSELYDDTSDDGVPRAVISARFFLLDESNVDAVVLFTKDYRQAEPVGGVGADNLARAWGRAMGRMLEQLTADLRSYR